jgi:excisionase family DNA binding protein
MARDSSDEFISTRQAADMLGVALRTVQLWVEAGVLRAWKTAGGHRRVVRSSVEALLAERAAVLAGPPGRQAGARAPEAADRDRPFRLLVVEDEPVLLKLFKARVAKWKLPLELHTAENGFEGLIRIGTARPDLLVTDLNMPGMDGFRMLRELRASTDFGDLRVVVMTALGEREIADRGGLPADIQVFAKPVSFTALEDLVRREIDAWRQRTGAAAPVAA